MGWTRDINKKTYSKPCEKCVEVSSNTSKFNVQFNCFHEFLNFIFSVCGYNNQYSFENFGDNDIEFVERFVRTELLQLLSDNCRKMQITLNDSLMKNFFGSHAFQPHSFRFEQEEKEFLKMISDIMSVPDGIQLNIHDNDDISKKWETFRGWYFNDLHENECRRDLQAPKAALNHLSQLSAIAKNNALRPKNGYRYPNAFKRFYVYNRLLSGPLAYKTLHANSIGVIPSISTINKYIHRPDHGLIEGQLRNEELLVYLRERNQPLWVSLSEDATRIDNRIEYCPRSNQLIGFVLPMNKENGMPIPFAYKADSAVNIIEHFNAPISDDLITIMAQPLGGASSFCLMLFGSDKRYTATEVSKRWLHIVNELKQVGIGVLSISSDSDPKYNKAMRLNSMLGLDTPLLPSNNLFRCGNGINNPFYVQDTPHLGTKLRNFLLKTFKKPEKIPFGRYFVEMDHLQYLVNNFGRDEHLLTSTVLNPVDKQNVESVLRIIDNKVIDMLKLHLKGESEGTVMFLEMMSNLIQAYMSESLLPIERLAKIWHALFIVRIWRCFVLNNPKLTLKQNFISSNCYSCIEQNAHSMVLIILFLKKNNLPELFVPPFYSSQPCESFYRRLRSFCPTFSMIATCSVKGAMARVSKAQLLNEISNDNDGSFVFPQNDRAAKNPKIKFSGVIDLPSQDEMIKTILKSKSDAINSAVKIGLIAKKSGSKEENCFCPIKPCIPKKENNLPHFTHNMSKDESSTPNDIKHEHLFANLSLKNYKSKFENKRLNETSPYVEIPFVDYKKRFIVLKTSLCWLLSKGGGKLSSDRLLRVQQKCGLSKRKTKKVRRVKSYSIK